MNTLEATVAALLISEKQRFLWTMVPGAGWRALVRLVAAVLLIGCVIGTIEIADGTVRPAPGTVTNAEVPAFHPTH